MREVGLHSGEVFDLLDQRAIPILTRAQLFLGPHAFGDLGVILNARPVTRFW